MATNSANASISTPYTWIMPLLAKNLKKLPPPLDEDDSLFFGAFLVVFLAALACRVIVVVLDVLGFDAGFAAT